MGNSPNRALCHLTRLVVVALVLWPCMVSSDEARYFYDPLGRLNAVIDGQGNVAIYEYDAVGNILSISRTQAPTDPAVIDPVTPDVIGAGTSTLITISGSNFLLRSATAAASACYNDCRLLSINQRLDPFRDHLGLGAPVRPAPRSRQFTKTKKAQNLERNRD